MNKDAEMPTSRDIYPKLKALSTSRESNSLEILLEKYWKTRGYLVEKFKFNNRISNEPQILIKGNRVYFNFCNKDKNQRDYNLQIAIAVIKSCRGDYDSLPGINADDDKFDSYKPNRITHNQAQEADELLKELAKIQFETDR